MNKGSEIFIEYAKAKLKDGWTYHEMFRKAHATLLEYEQMPPIKIRKLMVAKLTKAADEYGSPLDNRGKYNVEKEIEMEVMDLVFGWPFIRDYLNDNPKST